MKRFVAAALAVLLLFAQQEAARHAAYHARQDVARAGATMRADARTRDVAGTPTDATAPHGAGARGAAESRAVDPPDAGPQASGGPPSDGRTQPSSIGAPCDECLLLAAFTHALVGSPPALVPQGCSLLAAPATIAVARTRNVRRYSARAPPRLS